MRVLNKYSECNNTIGNYPALYHTIIIYQYVMDHLLLYYVLKMIQQSGDMFCNNDFIHSQLESDDIEE